jgi:hypothetical protein
MTWSWLVVFMLRGEAEVVDALLMRPALAFRLAIPSTEGGKMGSWLHTPGVLTITIVHAVHTVGIGLDAHTGSILLDPLARLAAPTVTPIWGCALDKDLIPTEALHVVHRKVVALGLDRGQVVNVLGGSAKLVHKDPATTIVRRLSMFTLLVLLVTVHHVLRQGCTSHALCWTDQPLISILPSFSAWVLVN